MIEGSGTRPPVPNGRRVPLLRGDPEQTARREFSRRVLRASLIVDSVAVATVLVAVLAWKLREVLLLVVIALFVTLLLHPVVSYVERRGVRRGLAVGIVFVLGVAVVATLLFVILNPLIAAAEHLGTQLPRYIRDAERGKGTIGHYVKKFHLSKYVTSKNGGVQSLLTKLEKPALSIGKGVLSGVVGIVTIFFLTFFLLIHAPRIYNGILEWMRPERSERVRAIMEDVEHSVVGYIAGDFATSLIAGAIITLTLLGTGVPYPLVLGIWVAIVDFLPLVGGLLAGVPTVILAALHSTTAGIITLIVFLAYQELENHVLYPIIMSRTVRLNSLWVLVSVLLGAELGDIVGSVFGGFVGALLAVPAGSAVQVVARDLWQHRKGTLLQSAAELAPPVAVPVVAGDGEGGLSGDEPEEEASEDGAEPGPDAIRTGRARDREHRKRRRRRPGSPPSPRA